MPRDARKPAKHGRDHCPSGTDPIPCGVQVARVDAGSFSYSASSLNDVEFPTIQRTSSRFSLVTYNTIPNQLQINPGRGFYQWEAGCQGFEDPDDDAHLEIQMNLDAVDGTRNTLSSKQGLNDSQLNEEGFIGVNHYIPDTPSPGTVSMNWRSPGDWTLSGWFSIFEDTAYVISMELRYIRNGVATSATIENPFIALARLGEAGTLL